MPDVKLFDPDSVRAELLHLADSSSTIDSNATGWPAIVSRQVTIVNGRQGGPFTLYHNGFRLLPRLPLVENFYDPDEVRSVTTRHGGRC